MHPQTQALLGYFKTTLFPDSFRETSKRYHEMASHLASTLDGPELTVALRKLLESKDAAVRASVGGKI